MDTTSWLWSDKFFRITLLRNDPDNTVELLRSLEKDRKQIEKDIAMVVFYMNGGLNYVDAYHLSMDQLHLLSSTVNEHYEKQAEGLKKPR